MSSLPRFPDRMLGPATAIIVLLLLEAGSYVGLEGAGLPPVSADLRALYDQVGTGAFWEAVFQTMQGWAIGLAIAVAIAIPVGIVIGASPLFYRASRVMIELLRPIPSVALIPLAVLVYGVGLKSTLFLVIFASFWPMLVQTLYGVQDVDPVATDTARSFGFGKVSRLFQVTLPGAAPYLATGVRISSTVALVLAVTAELVIGSPGLGHEIDMARSAGAYPIMYALIIATGLIGWGLNSLFAVAERRMLYWHPSYRTSVE